MTPAARRRHVRHHAFVALVFVAGVLALAESMATLAVSPPVHWWWVTLALVTILTGFFTVKVPTVNATLSISEIFLFSLVLLYGGAPGVVTVALDGLIVSLTRRHRQARHAAFNMAEPAVSMWVAAQAYEWVSGVPPLSVAPATLVQIGPAALALAAVYFLLNAGLNVLAVSTDSGRSPSELFRKYFVWVSLNYFGGASIAVLMAVNTRTSSFSSLLAITPLVVISYLTFKSAMGRLEDENVHLAEVNRLYLKVVETLAMAVDAKDQVTHGHVQRVQTFALRLADALGANDQLQKKAIEAASLLHDIGKIAVPEHILNKPGKLTQPEYDRMKLHAPLGADMLTAVGFPYPVVPIVRHHHENWDGTGYPDGLSGEAIPIGARILSVVDCYDALRSHRPYRRALSPEDAMTIVLERRGTMYDPVVVDAFVRIQESIERESVAEPLPEIIERVVQAARQAQQVDTATETLPLGMRLHATDMLMRLYERLGTLDANAPVETLCDVVEGHLRRLAPASLTVFFQRDELDDQLRAIRASGFGESIAARLTIPMGQGVSGWVAAQRRAVINADAALDFGDQIDALVPRHRSVLAVPLVAGSRIIGAMTLYSVQSGAFSDEQRLALELLAPAVGEALAAALARRPAGCVNPAPSSVDHHHLALSALLEHDGLWTSWAGRPLGVLSVRIPGDLDLMGHTAVAVAQATRIADLVFRPSDDELVVLMPDCDIGAGQMIAERIRTALSHPSVGEASTPRLALGFACAPHDGHGVARLLDTARVRAGRDDAERPAVAATVSAACPTGRVTWLA
ncbi:MAG: HD domain-containing phosphohydrolase [Acidobacteriota bacterium]